MKKLILFTAVIFITGIAFGQALPKGTLIGTHVITVSLNPGVTMDKYMEFVKTKLLPELDKNMQGWKVYLLKGIRGEETNNFGLLYVIKSEKERDKYYNPDGSDSDAGKALNEKLKPISEELAKLGTFTTKYTDWIIQ